MPFYLGLIIAIINYIVLLKNEEKGLILFSVLFVTCPVTIIGSISLYYSYLFLPFLLIWAITHPQNYYDRPMFVLGPLMIYFCITIFATAFSSINNIGKVNYFSFIGILRYLIILAILSTRKHFQQNFIKILKCIVLINVFAITIELLLLQIWTYDSVVQLWLKLYGTLGNSGSLDSIMEFGSLGRLQGTFASSAFPGTLSYVGIGMFLLNYFKERKWSSIFMILCSIYIGFASASKRFFLGAVVIVAICMIIKLLWGKNLHSDYKFGILLGVAFITVSYLYVTLSENLGIEYYADYLLRGDFIGSTETRFGEDGVVNSMIPYIEKYWLFGLGETIIENVLVTDSAFYITLFSTGILGMIAFIVMFVNLIIRALSIKNVYVYIILYTIMFEYIISNEFFSSLGIFFLAFATATCNHRKHRSVKTALPLQHN